MSYSTTKSRVLQYVGIILIIGVFAGAYWYFKVYGSTVNQSQNDLVTNGLVGMWSFNGDDISGTTAYDRGTGGNNGTITNTPTRVLGKVGQALSFNGTTQYVSVAQASSINTFTALTVSAWVKPTVTSGNYIIVRKNNDTGGTNHDLYQLDIVSNKFRFLVAANGSGVQTAGNDTTITAGIWYHLIGTWDGTTVKLYVNAAQEPTTDTLSGTIATSTFSALGIGRSNDTTDAYFSGIIDEVRIYSRAVAVGEIQSLYTAGGGTKSNTSISQPQGTGRLDSGLAGYWKMDDASGNTAVDASTNGNNLGASATAAWTTGYIGGASSYNATYAFRTGADQAVHDVTDGSNFTLTGWFNRSTFTGDDFIIAKRIGISAANTGYALYIDDATDKVTFEVSDGTDEYQLESVSTFTATGWHHFTIVWNDASATETKMYIDGVAEAATTTGTFGNINSLANAEVFTIAATSVLGTLWDGSLDEIRLYSRALSSDEVSQLYRLTTPTMVDTGLKGYWSFNAQDMNSTTAYDRSGAGNTGTLTNGPTKVVGKIGQAVSFDGSDDYVTVADNVALDIGDTDDLTLSGWLYRDTFTTDDTVIAKRNGIAAGDTGYIAYIDDATDQLIFEVSDGTDEYSLTSSSIFTTTGWNHFAIVWDQDSATNSEIYINGVANGATDTGTIGNIGDLSNAVTFRTGAESDNGNPYDGNLDEVRVYKRALTAAEIKGHYDLGESDKTNSSISQPQGTGRLDSGLAGYWPLDNGSGTSATDSSTNGNTGTLTNGPTWTTGQIGSAVDFDGTDDYIEIGSNIKVDNSDRGTIATWIKWDSFPVADRSIFSFGGGTVANAGRLYLYLDFSNSKLTIRQNSDGETADTVQGSTVFVTGTWYHVAAVSNGSSVSLYVNGAQESLTVSSGTNTGDWFADTTVTGTQRSLWGRQYVNGSLVANPLNGQLDEAYIYNRALSADEVAQLYRLNAPTGVETGLKGYWSFNGQDVSGTTAYDRSGAGNTGTLTNSPTKTIGKIGQGLSFDGSDDYVSVGTSTLGITAGSTGLTLASWVKVTTFQSYTVMIGKSHTSTYGGWQLNTNADSGNRFGGGVNVSGTWTAITSANTYSTDVWYHVSMTYDGAALRLYVNGMLDNTVSAAGTIQYATSEAAEVNIGRNPAADVPLRYLTGSLDEVRIYNRTLSVAEITALYNQSR